MSAITYLLQVSGCMAVFYLFYYVLLNRLTFFTTNRYYLLGTLVLSFVIPALTIPVHPNYTIPVMQQLVQANSAPAGQIFIIHTPQVAHQPFNWLLLLKAGYILVAAGLFTRLIVILVSFFIRLKYKQVKRVGHINIIHGNKKLTNGSFLNYIFLDDEQLDSTEIQQVIAHEMLHVKLMHSADRILVKIIQIILWFNPFAYLYARSIEENHEFEVDREIARAGNKHAYADLLLHLSVADKRMLYHSFSKVPLKKRIMMLFNRPTAKIKQLVYVLVIPVLVFSCLAFASFKEDDRLINNLIKPAQKLLTSVQNYTVGKADISVTKTPDAVIYAGTENKTAKTRDTSKSLKITPDTTHAIANQDMSNMSHEEIRKIVASAKFDGTKFYSRAVLEGGEYDMIRIKLNGTMGMTTLPHNGKVAFVIKGVIHEESEIAGFTQEQMDAIDTGGMRIGPTTRANEVFPNLDFSKYAAYVVIGVDPNSISLKTNLSP